MTITWFTEIVSVTIHKKVSLHSTAAVTGQGETMTWYEPNKIKKLKEIEFVCDFQHLFSPEALHADTSIIDSRRSLWYFTSYTLLIYLLASY